MDFFTISGIVRNIYYVILSLIRIYSFIWFIWIIISWLTAFGLLRLDYHSPAIRFLAKITDGVVDAVFGNFRRIFVVGMLDLSPLVFLIVLTMIFPKVLAWIFNMLLAFLSGKM